jgi:hypothetical protein
MQITRTYNAGLDKVHVGEIDGHPYLCIPEGLFLFTDDPPEELLGKGLVVSLGMQQLHDALEQLPRPPDGGDLLLLSLRVARHVDTPQLHEPPGAHP